MLYKFELGHYGPEATKNIGCMKGGGAVDHIIVNRWFKKFYSRSKNLDDQANLTRPKTMDSEAVL